MTAPTVLVVTHTRDHTVPDWVLAAVEARGGRGLRVDLDRYPMTLDL
jgi:hypothetical protein